jgi:hypothetical protein
VTVVPRELEPLAARLARGESKPLTADALLEQLAHSVRQANVLELPGVVAAYLDGRVTSWGAPPADWVRLFKGKAYDVPVGAISPDLRINGEPARSSRTSSRPDSEGDDWHRLAAAPGSRLKSGSALQSGSERCASACR